MLQSDNSALAKDCRKEMKALNTRLIKLGGWGRGGNRAVGRAGSPLTGRSVHPCDDSPPPHQTTPHHPSPFCQ